MGVFNEWSQSPAGGGAAFTASVITWVSLYREQKMKNHCVKVSGWGSYIVYMNEIEKSCSQLQCEETPRIVRQMHQTNYPQCRGPHSLSRSGLYAQTHEKNKIIKVTQEIQGNISIPHSAYL